MNLELSDDERALLEELLDIDYRNLKDEISNTDSPFFKETLKARERTLLDILDKVRRARVEP